VLKKTALYKNHIDLKAKMVPFAGWEMPVFYPAGIIAEHKAVRSSCGVFDVGHMGLINIKPQTSNIKKAEEFLNKIGTNDVSKLIDFSCQYSVLCNEQGGVVDDVLIYKLIDHYIVVVNASNTDKVLAWLSSHAQDIEIEHLLDMSILAVQGPRSLDVIEELFGEEFGFNVLKRNNFLQVGNILVSRTGYTGEDGFELFIPLEEIEIIWDKVVEMKVQPCGLGARDTLRMEAAYPLYGHEYDEKTTPLDAGYSWAVKFGKGEFIGSKALSKEKEAGPKKRLVGVVLSEKNVPREGFKLFNGGAEPIGEITSGTFSPTLEKPIGLAYINNSCHEKNISVEVRGRRVAGEIVTLPFYKHS